MTDLDIDEHAYLLSAMCVMAGVMLVVFAWVWTTDATMAQRIGATALSLLVGWAARGAYRDVVNAGRRFQHPQHRPEEWFSGDRNA